MLPEMKNKLQTGAFQKQSLYESPRINSRKLLLELIFSEHTYAKPFSLDPDFNRTHLTSVLKFSNSEGSTDDKKGEASSEEEIDILSISKPKEPLVQFDRFTSNKQILEIEECFQMIHREESWLDDDGLSRTGWTRDQSRLFDQVNKILSTYQMARCTYKGHENEGILRHAAIVKAMKRFRTVAASVAWETKVMSWLHTVLLDGLNSSLFLCYLELLQILKTKVPSLVEKMILNALPCENRNAIINSAPIVNCLKKPFHPSPAITSRQFRSKKTEDERELKMENKPLLFMLPRGPARSLSHPNRFCFWQKQLSSCGRLVQINIHVDGADEPYPNTAYLESVIGVTRTRLSAANSRSPLQPIFLVGWSIGSLLACQVSALENAAGVICLGYPCNGLDGLRETENDPCLEAKCPLMFVIGAHSSTCSVEYIEVLREKLRVDTRLLIIEGGDEMLKLTASHKKRLEMTQDMVDRLIMDQIEQFIHDVLSKPTKSKENSRPDTPNSGMQQYKIDKKRKHKKLEGDKEVIDKKRKRSSSPFTKMPGIGTKLSSTATQNKTKPSTQNPNTGVDDSLDVSKSTTTSSGLITKGMMSRAPPVARVSNKSGLSSNVSSAALSTIPTSNHAAVQGSHITKHLMKRHSGNHNEKLVKKSKLNRKPTTATGSFCTTTQPSSKSTMLAVQPFSTSSSMMLSNAGAKVRLHDGRILYVPGSDSKIPLSSNYISSGQKFSTSSALLLSSSGVHTVGNSGRPIAIASQRSVPIVKEIGAPRLHLGAAASGSAALREHTASSAPVSSTFFMVRNVSAPTYSESKHTGSDSGSTSTLLSASVDQISAPAALSSPTNSSMTQLSSADLKYLTDLCKSSLGENPSSKANDGTTDEKSPEKCFVSTSPISAKIGIGTLTNLPNADGSPPGTGTRVSPSAKQAALKGEKESPTVKTTQSSKCNTSDLPRGCYFPKRDLFDLRSTVNSNQNVTKTISNISSPKMKPSTNQATDSSGTVTIPTYNTSRSFAMPAHSKKQTNSNSSKEGCTVKSGLSRQLSSQASASNTPISSTVKSTMGVSSYMKRATPRVTAAIADNASNRQTQTMTISSSAKLTVTAGRPIQSTSIPSKKNPQTITLHIPNTAMLKDPNKLRNVGSEIKLISLLNQPGKSPISSPIHFAVRSKSAPGSPQSQSPTIVFSSKSDPPTPKAVSKSLELSNNELVSTNAKIANSVEKSFKVPACSSSPCLSSTSKACKSEDSKRLVAATSNSQQTSRNLNTGIKFSKPATVQTALIKSLTAASLSVQQQESISTLLKNQEIKNTQGDSCHFDTKRLIANSTLMKQNSKQGENDTKDIQKGKLPEMHRQPHPNAKAVNGHVKAKSLQTSESVSVSESTNCKQEKAGDKEKPDKSASKNYPGTRDRNVISAKNHLPMKSSTSTKIDYSNMNIKNVAARIVRISLDNDDLSNYNKNHPKFGIKGSVIGEVGESVPTSNQTETKKEMESKSEVIDNHASMNLTVDKKAKHHGMGSQEVKLTEKDAASSHKLEGNFDLRSRKRKMEEDAAEQLTGSEDADMREDTGSSAKKIFVQKSSTSKNEEHKLSTPQKTEE